ncbi:uncharacterized protein [Apostichopus japonicus]|uniref:uncharacterized protein isoform X2 n=1 Tax=Stichopus japonicus TaxID=307972 RepID=UPI003AB50516
MVRMDLAFTFLLYVLIPLTLADRFSLWMKIMNQTRHHANDMGCRVTCASRQPHSCTNITVLGSDIEEHEVQPQLCKHLNYFSLIADDNEEHESRVNGSRDLQINIRHLLSALNQTDQGCDALIHECTENTITLSSQYCAVVCAFKLDIHGLRKHL